MAAQDGPRVRARRVALRWLADQAPGSTEMLRLVIDVDRKVIEVAGQLAGGAPKGRKRRKTIYPVRTPHDRATGKARSARG